MSREHLNDNKTKTQIHFEILTAIYLDYFLEKFISNTSIYHEQDCYKK